MPNTSHHAQDHGDSHGLAFPMPFLYPFFCLSTGLVFDALFSQSLATVCMLAISFGLTSVANLCLTTDVVADFLDKYTWTKLDAHTIMFALLPTLIFESAFALDAHHFKRYAGQLLMFAGPAFVLAFVSMGAMVHLMMCVAKENDMWTLGFCMMYGAIVSATDPVAVVALLKALGVPHHLKVLIEGESLFNDGAAIFFHSLIHTILAYTFDVQLEGQKVNLYTEISYRLAGVLGSVAIGLILARLTALILGNLFDSVRERAVVVIFVYACYAAAESIKGSGVLCLVVFGISLNARRQWMSSEAYVDNKRMWGFLAYFANCIIFITTGVFAGRDLFRVDDMSHAGLGVLAYLFSVISRAMAIIIFAGALIRRFGPYPPEYSPILIWGGLRGALALLLALTAKNDPVIVFLEKNSNAPKKLYGTMLAFISITVILSNLVQGITSGPLTKKLGLCGMSAFQFAHLKGMKRRFNAEIKAFIEKKRANPFYDLVKWNYVEKRTELSLHLETEQSKHDEEDGTEDVEEEARENVQRCYEAQLWALWNSGFLSVDVRALHHAINEAATSHGPLNVEKLYDHLKTSKWRRRLGMFCLKLKRTFGIAKRLKWLADRPQMQDVWYMVAGIIACIQGSITIYLFVKSNRKNDQPHSADEHINKYHFFGNMLLILFLGVEPIFRLWSNRDSLRDIYLRKGAIWPWVDLMSVALYLCLFGVYIAIFRTCTKGGPVSFDHGQCAQLRIGIIFGALSLLKLPQVLVLLGRFLVEVEITGVLQRKDEEALEGLNALITMTDIVKQRLDNGTLIDDQELLKKLSDECSVVKKNAEKRLSGLMRKDEAKPLMTTIKTRQVCREVLSEAKRMLLKFEEDGNIGEIEMEHLGNAITVCERRVQGLHRLVQKQLHDSELSDLDQRKKQSGAITKKKPPNLTKKTK